MYLFYQLPIESAFHVEDRKIERGYYYKTDSPYGGSVIFRKLIFSGNNKYFAIARIIVLIIVLIILVYILKDKVYASCSCSLELWSDFDWNIFPHAENFYQDKLYAPLLGLLHLIFVHICVLGNSSGNLDDYILFDGFRIKTIKVSEFLPRDRNHLISYKIRKISFVLSFQFLCPIICFNYPRSAKKGKLFWGIKCLPQFLSNFVMVLISTFLPVISTILVGSIKIGDKCVHVCKCKSKTYKGTKQIVRWIFFLVAIGYLGVTYFFSFNFFFNGISYFVQFLIFTLCLAVPRFPVQYYIYVVFITSAILYVYRFFSQFAELYKSLLETILSIVDKNEIQITVFNNIVEKYFPISYEVVFFII